MDIVKNAIEQITYRSKKFPKEAFQTITANKEESIPYLRAAIDKALLEGDNLDASYQLHFYALFLLGEFQDRDSFPQIMKLASLPADTLDYLIGDATTGGLSDILYNTYNEDLDLLKDSIQNPEYDEYSKNAMLQVMGQLYLDGTISKEEWIKFIRQNIHSGREYDYTYNTFASMICQCHLIEILPEIRYLFDNGLIDDFAMGRYDAYVDKMFSYSQEEQRICQMPINAAGMLNGWAMFEQKKTVSPTEKKKALKAICEIDGKRTQGTKKTKIQRNDPCPCGSGKKYKFCCLNKPKEPIDLIEEISERNKYLEHYPETGTERQEGRVYLEDYYDSESIEIDKLLYLGMKNRKGFIWNRNEEAERNRKREYLKLAFALFTKRIDKEQINTFAKYDEKYSIHYTCVEWISELKQLLQESGEKDVYSEVCQREKSLKSV